MKQSEGALNISTASVLLQLMANVTGWAIAVETPANWTRTVQDTCNVVLQASAVMDASLGVVRPRVSV